MERVHAGSLDKQTQSFSEDFRRTSCIQVCCYVETYQSREFHPMAGGVCHLGYDSWKLGLFFYADDADAGNSDVESGVLR